MMRMPASFPLSSRAQDTGVLVLYIYTGPAKKPESVTDTDMITGRMSIYNHVGTKNIQF